MTNPTVPLLTAGRIGTVPSAWRFSCVCLALELRSRAPLLLWRYSEHRAYKPSGTNLISCHSRSPSSSFLRNVPTSSRNSPPLCRPTMHYRVHRNLLLLPILSRTKLSHFITPCFFKNPFHDYPRIHTLFFFP
jgi:hypothetical protein